MKVLRYPTSLDTPLVRNAIYLSINTDTAIANCVLKTIQSALKECLSEDVYENQVIIQEAIVDPTDLDSIARVNWNNKARHYASCMCFYNDFNYKSTNSSWFLTLSQWLKCERIVFICPGMYKDTAFADLVMANEVPTFEFINDGSEYIAELMTRPSQKFFTADTHFNEDRTLKLSKRPWHSTYAMTLGLISNWNKRILNQDTVYHLGDFGDPTILKVLNGSSIEFTPGNHDIEGGDNFSKVFYKDKRVRVFSPSLYLEPTTVKLRDKTFIMVHEPLAYETAGIALSKNQEPDCWMFGHIHRLGVVKRNGVNVGIDTNQYRPLSESDVLFLADWLSKFDKNVYCTSCR